MTDFKVPINERIVISMLFSIMLIKTEFLET